MEFIKADIPVFSNAKNYRQHPQVPLVVPTVNLSHLSLIQHQRKEFGLKKGFPRLQLKLRRHWRSHSLCSSPKQRFGEVEDVEVFTEQAVSGAGYPGVPSMDIFDNVVPYIPGEEDKLETEAQKILGSLNANATAFEKQKGLTVGATCTRVGVTDGHMAFVSLRFKNRPGPTAEQAKEAMREYVADAQKARLPFGS